MDQFLKKKRKVKNKLNLETQKINLKENKKYSQLQISYNSFIFTFKSTLTQIHQ